MDTNFMDWLSMLLVIVGAITWGILGLTGLISGDPLNVARLVIEGIFLPAAGEVVLSVLYVLVGLAGVYLLYTAYKMGRASRRTRSPSTPDADT